jgi:hypothetical protein
MTANVARSMIAGWFSLMIAGLQEGLREQVQVHVCQIN